MPKIKTSELIGSLQKNYWETVFWLYTREIDETFWQLGIRDLRSARYIAFHLLAYDPIDLVETYKDKVPHLREQVDDAAAVRATVAQFLEQKLQPKEVGGLRLEANAHLLASLHLNNEVLGPLARKSAVIQISGLLLLPASRLLVRRARELWGFEMVDKVEPDIPVVFKGSFDEIRHLLSQTIGAA